MPQSPAPAPNRDILGKALFRAVGLILMVVLINTVRDGWNGWQVLLTVAIGLPLVGAASFVADRYIQPAVQRRVANRR